MSVKNKNASAKCLKCGVFLKDLYYLNNNETFRSTSILDKIFEHRYCLKCHKVYKNKLIEAKIK